MDDSTRNDDIAERLGALAQWHPPSSVGLTAVVRAGRRRRAVRVAGMGGLAAVAVVATTVAALALGGGRGTAPATTTPTVAPTVSAAPVGEARAAMAAAAPDPVKALDESSWADAPYWYAKTLNVSEVFLDGDVPTETQTYTRETWTAHRDHSLMVEDGDLSTALGSGWGGWPLDDFDPTTDDAWDMLFALPTDPSALGAELRRAVADAAAAWGGVGPRNGSVDDKVWGQIADVYPGSPASAELRMAFMQVAVDLPGTTVTPGVADSQGRVGVAISRHDVLDDPRSEVTTLIVDPVDGTVLERRTGGRTTTYLSMGPAWDLPVEPVLDAGCVDWATC
ncbi:MAG: hypothetical protein FWH11_10975 [Micrococcales bacterium]|nr:hypothetical protein [Micrococcales bacterium]